MHYSAYIRIFGTFKFSKTFEFLFRMLEGKIIFPTSRWWAKSVHEIKSYCDFSVLFHRLFNLMKYIHNKIVVLFANLNISRTKQDKLKIESASLWVLDSIKKYIDCKGGRPRKKLCFAGIWSAPLQGAESRYPEKKICVVDWCLADIPYLRKNRAFLGLVWDRVWT